MPAWDNSTIFRAGFELTVVEFLYGCFGERISSSELGGDYNCESADCQQHGNDSDDGKDNIEECSGAICDDFEGEPLD